MGSRIAIALVVLFGCSKDTAKPAPKREKPVASRPKPKLPEAVLVGTVARAGDQVCPKAGEDRWINVHYQVGFVPVIVSDADRAGLDALRGKLAVVYGQVADKGPPRDEQPPADAVECPPEQWRSDWVRGPDGVRMRRSDGPGIAAFAVERVEPFTGLSAGIDGNGITVELQNMLKQPLAAPVELVAHYEGCYGKPGTRTETATAEGGLVTGERLSFSFPTMTTDHDDPRLGGRRGKGEHAAHSIEIRASGKNVYFDADVPLSVYGIAVDCPK